MNTQAIEKTVSEIVQSLPAHIKLVAAAKTRSAGEAAAAIRGGVRILGYNYVQEAEKIHAEIGKQAEWHMIGHLQRNKVKTAVRLFDMIETIDSVRLAEAVHKQCAAIGKIMPVLIEVNSGREPQKSGVFPEEVKSLVREVSGCANLRIQGLMTMAPYVTDEDELRGYFRATKAAFEHLKTKIILSFDNSFDICFIGSLKGFITFINDWEVYVMSENTTFNSDLWESEGVFDLYDSMISDSQIKIPDVLHHVTEVLCQNLNAERATIYLIDKSTHELESAAFIGNVSRTIRIPITDNSLAGFCAVSGRCFVVPDFRAFWHRNVCDRAVRFPATVRAR